MASVRQRRGANGRTTQESNGGDQNMAPEQEESSGMKVFLQWTALSVFSFLLCAYLFVELFMPCPIDPRGHYIGPIPPAEGPLEQNNHLASVQKLFPGQFNGPESMAFYNGKMYTGVADGRILEIDLETNAQRTLVQQLGVPPCGGHVNEKNCGRPLGVRAKNGYLYVVDAYLGLFKIDLKTGEVQNLFRATDKMPDGLEPKLLNDVEVTEDGKVYVTDSSYRWPREKHSYVGFEGRPDGRLIVYDPAINDTRIVLRDLYFANGLELGPNEEYILITEMSLCRVQKYYIKGPLAGHLEMFAENLPGMPDNIRSNGHGGYWVGIAMARSPHISQLWDIILPYPYIKSFLAKIWDNNGLTRLIVPRYGLIVELDGVGRIIRSMHDPPGTTIPSVSEVQEYNGKLYIGSYFLPFLGKMDL